MYVIPVDMLLVPGKDTFARIPDARISLVKYGWPNAGITIDSGRIGKITVAEKRTIVFTLSGKTSSDALASKDVKDALANVGLLQHVVGNIAVRGTGAAVAVASAAAGAAGEAAGKAASGIARGIGIKGIVVAVFTLALLTAVAVFVAKKA